MEALFQDLRFGARQLGSSPGFTAVAALTLALAIGANAAIFSVLDAVLLRPLPFDHPQRVVQIRDHYPHHEWDQISVPNFHDYRAETRALFRRFGALQRTSLYLVTPEGDLEVSGTYFSADLLRMLSVEPQAGRFFSDEEEAALAHVAILTHDFAQSRFGGADEAIGRTLTMKYWSMGSREGQPRGYHAEVFTVVGVAPPGLTVPPVLRRSEFHTYEPEVLLPMGLWSWGWENRGMYAFPVLAELEAGVPVEAARARLETVAARIAAEHPDTNGDYEVSVVPLGELLANRYRATFLLLGGAVGMVLLLACVNVATLLLGRSTVRRTEFAVRRALGAGRRRLARQVLTESSLLALAGGTCGLLVAYGATGVLVSLMPSEIPRIERATIDLRTVAFTFAIAALTVLLFGSMPALGVGRRSLGEDLKEGGRSGSGASRRFLTNLQIAEVALAVVLLVGAGLLTHSLLRLTGEDLGVETRRLLVSELELSPPELSKYAERRQSRSLWTRIRERLSGVPGVDWVEATSEPPIDGGSGNSELTLADPARPGTHATTDYRFVSPGYLRGMGIALRAGRYFEETDLGRPVVIVDETLARRFWPDGDALDGEVYWGRQDLTLGLFPRELDELALKDDLGPEERERADQIYAALGDRIDPRYPIPFRMRVVGVVENVKNRGPTVEGGPQAYAPLTAWRSVSFVMRTALPPELLAAPVAAAIREVDPVEPEIASLRTAEDYASATVAEPRFQTTLVGIFAGLALLLATVGLYGVVSYSVARRIREMGVRRALGAQRRDIFRLVVGEALRIAVWGLVPGVAAGLAVSRYLRSLLYEIGPTDPWTYGGVCALLLAVTLAASIVPARRAVRADPVEVLRAE